MGGIATVGIDDDLAPGQAGVPRGAAQHKAAGGVDEVLGVVRKQLCGNFRADNIGHHVPGNLLLGHLRSMLGGNDHRIHRHGAAVLVGHGYLALSVRPQVGQGAVLSHLGQAAGQTVGQGDGHGHHFGGLVTGKTEHHALVARAGFVLRISAGFEGRVNAHGDVGALGVDGGHYRAAVPVKAQVRGIVADVQHHLTGNFGNLHIGAGGDFAHNHHHAGGGEGFAGHTGHGIALQDGVQHRVADLVAHFVGMPLGNGFRGKQLSHGNTAPFTGRHADCPQKKTARLAHQSGGMQSFDRPYLPALPLAEPVPRCGIWHQAEAGCRDFIGPIPPSLVIRYSLGRHVS